MQTTIETENPFLKTKSEQPKLLKRTIIDAVSNYAKPVVKSETIIMQKVKYPTNGLYGLL